MANNPRRSGFGKVTIIQKAGAWFWQRGYDATRMSDIARSCGCEASTLYNYFKSKEYLLYEVMREEMQQTVRLAEAVQKNGTVRPSEKLRLLIKNHIRLVTGEKRSSRLLFDSGLRSLSPAHRKKIIEFRDRYDKIVRDIIHAGIDSGEFAKMDETVVGFAVIAIIVRTRIWFSPTGRLSPDEIADILFEFVLHGLGSKYKEDGAGNHSVEGQQDRCRVIAKVQ